MQLSGTVFASEGLPLEFEKVDIQAIFESICLDHAILEISSSLPNVEADRDQIKKAFSNLVNLIVHSQSTSEDDQAKVKIAVQDNDLIIRLIAEGEKLVYFENEPLLFYSNAVIEKHGGRVTIEKTDSRLEMIIVLPILQG